jgi:D-arabinose 1-dehydrogenase-like Zn-dependent alcohol dehydrogenase
VNADWVFPIPDSLPTIGVAPLFEAGITVWAPFVQNKIKAGDRVGVIGLGGLGHLAIQIAVKMGCHTVGISTSASKAKEILSYGAQAFINSNDSKEMSAAAGTLDFVITTVAAPGVNWDAYLDLLRSGMSLSLVRN